jgi:phosphopentomutase
MLLDRLEERDVEVYAVGKIIDIYAGRGVRRYHKTKNNAEGMMETERALDAVETGVVFANLVDFDMLYGHRNDAEGYAAALEEFDGWLPSLEEKLSGGDLLMLCADHGCDPTTPSTDHSREYTPLLAYSPRAPRGAALGVRGSLSDMGQTVAENFGVAIANGKSFLHQIV